MSKIMFSSINIMNDESRNSILDLRNRVFGNEEYEKMNSDYWDWEFRNSYAGCSRIYVATEGDMLVAHYAVIPNNFFIEGKMVVGSLVVDVMVHDQYRRMGIFEKLGRYALDDSQDKGIMFSIGFPVRSDVMPGHMKIGWKHYFDLPVLAYPVNFTNIIAHFINNQFFSKIFAKPLALVFKAVSFFLYQKLDKSSALSISHIDNFDESFDDLWGRLKLQFDMIQERSSIFLNWRFSANPYRKYIKIKAILENNNVGYIVLKESEIYGFKSLIIADFLVDNFDLQISNMLLYEAIKLAKEKQVDLIGVKLIEKSRYYNYLRKKLFLPSGYRFKFIARNNMNINEDILKNDSEIYISWADSDTI